MDKKTMARAIVCVDYSNYHYYLNKKEWRIDWGKFLDYFRSLYRLEGVFYYEGVPSKGAYFDLHPKKTIEDFNAAKKAKLDFHRTLKQRGLIVRSKPVGRVYDNTEGCFKHKCNFDVEVTIDALDNLSRLDTFILCSGDGDFIKLIKYLKGKVKKTVVVAPGDRLSRGLEKAANRVIYLEDIRCEIEES